MFFTGHIGLRLICLIFLVFRDYDEVFICQIYLVIFFFVKDQFRYYFFFFLERNILIKIKIFDHNIGCNIMKYSCGETTERVEVLDTDEEIYQTDGGVAQGHSI